MSRLIRPLKGVLTIFVLSVAVGCGGDSRSPVGPDPAGPDGGSPSGPAPSTSGATLSGSVSASGSGVRALGAGVAGIKITIVGTSLVAVTGAGGRFMLPNVPPGLVRLQIEGAGATGSVEIEDVTEGEEIELELVVTGSVVELETEERVTGSQAQLEGKILSVDYAGGTLLVGTTTVVVPEGIPITKGYRELELTDLVVGARIHVKGSLAGDTLTATRIIVQQTGLESVKMSGVVSDVGGTCPNATFQFGSTVIAVNGSTIYVKGTCADIAGGADVDIKGLLRPDGTVLATQVKFNTKGGNGNGNKTIEVSGTVSGLDGKCPALRFSAGGRSIRTNGSTSFAIPCASLANGQAVTVQGKVTGNGTVNASRVQAGS